MPMKFLKVCRMFPQQILKISNISNIFASGTDKGIFELAGKSKIGQALGDEIDHMEFYVNKKAMVSTMSELFGIVEQKNKE